MGFISIEIHPFLAVTVLSARDIVQSGTYMVRLPGNPILNISRTSIILIRPGRIARCLDANGPVDASESLSPSVRLDLG